MLGLLHTVYMAVCSVKLSYYNEYKSYLRMHNEDDVCQRY